MTTNKSHPGDTNSNWRGGKTFHPLYDLYYDMLGRCYRSTHQRFASYGGRGIGVCDRWRADFWHFVEDMGPRPTSVDLSKRSSWSLDRIDNDQGYSPANCRWASYSQQALNRRRHGWESRTRDAAGQWVAKEAS